MHAVSQKILTFNKGRLPDILQLKYAAMCDNAFRFFRGTCHLFYERLAQNKGIAQSPLVWICGDLHLENFGSFRGSNNLTYFDLNDFDEAIRAPALWEVLRLITSILIAFQVLEIDSAQGINMAMLFIRRYRNTLSEGKPIGIEPRTARGIVCTFLKKADQSSAKNLLKKRTTKKGRHLYLKTADERHFKLDKELKKLLKNHMREFLSTSDQTPYNFEVRDVVFRLAGTGSLGQRRYLFLLQNKKDNKEFILLDMKEALPSSLMPYVDANQPEWISEGERIVSIQNIMQNVTAAMLSTTTFEGRSYIIQELQPVKDTIKFKLIRDDYRDIIQVIDDMAVLTASSQIRSSGTLGASTNDELMAFAKSTGWEDELIRYAQNSCEQVHLEYYNFIEDYQANKFSDSSLNRG